MASPSFDTKEIAAFRRKAGVLPVGAPLMDGPPPAPFSEFALAVQAASTEAAAALALPRVTLSKEPVVPAGEECALDLLLTLSGEAFVAAAYRATLGREADPEGLANFATKLASGELSKVEVLGRLRYSGEGCARGRRVKGLFSRYARLVVGKMPVAGPLLRTLMPERTKKLGTEALKSSQRADLETLAAQHNAMAEALERMLQELAARDAERAAETGRRMAEERSARGQAIQELARRIGEENRYRGEAVQEIVRRTDEEREVRGAAIEMLNANLEVLKAAHAARLSVLDQQKASIEAALQAQALSVSSLDHRVLRFEAEAPLPLPASFYAALQNRFRGDGDLVRERLSIYLPYLREMGAGTEMLPVLDLGCGRGEWLGLLGKSGFEASGVDESRVAVEMCRQRGFRATIGDALQHLKGIPRGSLGAVTAFHILEHLDAGRVLALLTEARRVLVPGGLLVVEMPNPENLRVAACYFYLDPTHRHPIPKELAQLFAERAGFEVREILPLNPFPPEEWPETANQSADVSRWLYGPRDYGLIAAVPRKAQNTQKVQKVQKVRERGA